MSHFHVHVRDFDGKLWRVLASTADAAEKEAAIERAYGRTDVHVDECSDECFGSRSQALW